MLAVNTRLTPSASAVVAGDPAAAVPPAVETSDYTHPIVASTSIDLPFSAQIAYDAFSDLPRQPSWSPWLQSVRLLDSSDDDSNDDESGPSSLWTMKIAGLSYSWKSISTRQERPHVIEWESTSGLRNRGRVDIQPADDADCENKSNGGASSCRMTLTMVFQAPRLVAALFRNDFHVLRERMEDRILRKTLSNFRDVVLRTDVLAGEDASNDHHHHQAERLRDSGMLFPP
jgi:uncharacterized membrane protein